MENQISFFKPGDYNEIKELLLAKDSKACDDCLLGLYVWKERYGFELQKVAGGNILYSKANGTFLFPFEQDETKAVSVIKALLESNDNLRMSRITEIQKEIIEENFPDIFEFDEDDGSNDYLYEAEALAELKGKKLSKKRNHVNAFLKFYDNWLVEPISRDNVNDCVEFARDWYMAKEEKTDGELSLAYEKQSLFNVLENMEQLEADGLLLRVEGSCVAFSVGQKISSHTFDVVFEKADEQVRGAYNIINREFVRYLRKKYNGLQFINRENDLGLMGLRKAKLSYMPCEILKKYNAVRKL